VGAALSDLIVEDKIYIVIDRLFCTPSVCVADNFSRHSLFRNERARCVREDLNARNRSLSAIECANDAELKAQLEAAAAREDRPVASYVRRIMMKALDAEREGAAA
jgi:hypothetical protein